MAKTQAILAYFNSEALAEKAKQQLVQQLDMKDEDCQIDRVSAQPGEATEKVLNPITSNFGGHETLIENVAPSNESVGRLLGSDPAVSGMADGSGMITGLDVLLTIVCPTDNVQQALQIVERNKGHH
ncbi:hypothetical protein CBW65_06690 [Tumebacillus avium]|uniref:General stress protein 17M-like domain-containing protein n=1 Tax=Tumebacillus avium TaxID=1903704 RepID=A0A1Y0IN90_9BACL|nr:hypothetical protein [Tumebacillus avium]ARU60814.1 hypothetical protein CBW65_06690 [Tumebacillus avium]